MRVAKPYLALMTSRLLLTLLALLTGFSVQESAVRARAMPAASTQVAAVCALATVRDARANSALSRPKAGATDIPYRLVPEADCTCDPAITPRVRTRIDRAHE